MKLNKARHVKYMCSICERIFEDFCCHDVFPFSKNRNYLLLTWKHHSRDVHFVYWASTIKRTWPFV